MMQEVDTESEAQLRKQLLAMDSDALALVYDRFYSRIHKYISFRVADAQFVEDLSSEVFTRLIASLKKGKVPEKLQAWLFGVANKVVIDHYRSANRNRWSEMDDQIASSAETPGELTDHSLLHDRLRKGLHKLNPKQQHVLALRFGFGMPFKEIAEQMGKSTGAIKMLQARAITALTKEVVE